MTGVDKNTTALSDKKLTTDDKPWLFKKGDDPRRNLEGRPVGSISPITRVKQIFEENPETFKEFIEEYIKNPNNAKHIVEMIDGKPKGSDTNINVDKAIFPIYGGLSVQQHHSNEEDI